MNGYADLLEGCVPLWDAPESPPRYVIWQAAEDDLIVFDREYNIPVDIEEAALGEVLRLMREAGVPESAEYPGRPCG